MRHKLQCVTKLLGMDHGELQLASDNEKLKQVAVCPMFGRGPQNTFFNLCEAGEMECEDKRFSSRETYS